MDAGSTGYRSTCGAPRSIQPRCARPTCGAAPSCMTLFKPASCPAAVLISLRLTAIALLLRPTGEWFVRPILLGAAALMLIFPQVLLTPAVWGAISLLLGIRIAADWPLADNHMYLLAYWALAVALSLTAPRPMETLGRNSRLLVGLAFACAVLWKAALAPDFRDGRFFRITLLTDPRFGDAAMLVGGLSPEQLEDNRQALTALPEGAELLDPPTVAEPPRLRVFAGMATWSALLLEATVAAAMLMPTTTMTATMRHLSLLVFCVVSYAFAPVAGFGWLLLVLGIAQCDPGQRRLRAAYVGTFVLVLFYAEVPWASLILRLRGS